MDNPSAADPSLIHFNAIDPQRQVGVVSKPQPGCRCQASMREFAIARLSEKTRPARALPSPLPLSPAKRGERPGAGRRVFHE
jgi:hypothetical protein